MRRLLENGLKKEDIQTYTFNSQLYNRKLIIILCHYNNGWAKSIKNPPYRNAKFTIQPTSWNY